MLFALTLIVLTRSPPSYEEKYLTGCYEGEDAERCKDRQARWKSDIKSYEDEQNEYEADDFKQLTQSKVTVEPDEGAVKIAPQKPSWCAGVTPDSTSWSFVPRSIENLKDARYLDINGIAKIGLTLCKKPDDKDVQRFAAMVLQSYVNITHVSAEDAVRNVTLRLNPKLVNSKKALCRELTVDEEAMGSAKTFGETRRAFFGCSNDDKTDDAEWTNGRGKFGFTQLQWYLDTTAVPESELMRLAYVLDTVWAPADDYTYKASSAAQYAWLQYDMKGMDPARLAKELDQPPFKDNDYAKLIASESLGLYLNNARLFEAFVKKTGKDDDWKNILYTAPQKATKDWEAMYAKYKSAFDNSKAFEDKLFQPSLKAAKGCSATLRPDFLAFLKTIKAPAADFEKSVTGNPMGNLLLERYSACASVEGQPEYADALHQVQETGRVSRGPRLASYYATIEAIGDVLKDRPKFPLDPKSLWAPNSDGDLTKRASEASKVEGMGLSGSQGSLVQSVSKTPKGTKIVFITTKYQYMSQSCTPTNRIFRIHDGYIEYYQSCHDTGLQWASNHMHDILIPNELAGNITAGNWVQFKGDPRDQPPALPLVVYSDKTKSKIVNWMGFAL